VFNFIPAKTHASERGRTIRFEGKAYGSPISLFSVDNDPGQGPVLHTHPYAETWICISGSVQVEVAGDTRIMGPNDIAVVPANTPHKHVNVGEGPLRMICIHPRETMIQTNLK